MFFELKITKNFEIRLGTKFFVAVSYQVSVVSGANISVTIMWLINIHVWAASCEKGPDNIFCPFLVLSFFANFIPQIT